MQLMLSQFVIVDPMHLTMSVKLVFASLTSKAMTSHVVMRGDTFGLVLNPPSKCSADNKLLLALSASLTF